MEKSKSPRKPLPPKKTKTEIPSSSGLKTPDVRRDRFFYEQAFLQTLGCASYPHQILDNHPEFNGIETKFSSMRVYLRYCKKFNEFGEWTFQLREIFERGFDQNQAKKNKREGHSQRTTSSSSHRSVEFLMNSGSRDDFYRAKKQAQIYCELFTEKDLYYTDDSFESNSKHNDSLKSKNGEHVVYLVNQKTVEAFSQYLVEEDLKIDGKPFLNGRSRRNVHTALRFYQKLQLALGWNSFPIINLKALKDWEKDPPEYADANSNSKSDLKGDKNKKPPSYKQQVAALRKRQKVESTSTHSKNINTSADIDLSNESVNPNKKSKKAAKSAAPAPMGEAKKKRSVGASGLGPGGNVVSSPARPPASTTAKSSSSANHKTYNQHSITSICSNPRVYNTPNRIPAKGLAAKIVVATPAERMRIARINAYDALGASPCSQSARPSSGNRSHMKYTTDGRADEHLCEVMQNNTMHLKSLIERVRRVRYGIEAGEYECEGEDAEIGEKSSAVIMVHNEKDEDHEDEADHDEDSDDNENQRKGIDWEPLVPLRSSGGFNFYLEEDSELEEEEEDGLDYHPVDKDVFEKCKSVDDLVHQPDYVVCREINNVSKYTYGGSATTATRDGKDMIII